MSSNQKNLYQQVYDLSNLQKAWRSVHQNISQSLSDQSKRELKEFDASLVIKLNKIHDDLKSHKFIFDKQKGVPLSRPNKSPRPLVISSIENRIVQRAILNVMQDRVDFVKQVMNTQNSYGGLKNKSVKDAIIAVHKLIKEGHVYFLRSDIPSFFTKINKELLFRSIQPHIIDNDFFDLFKKATETNLKNSTELNKKGYLDIFPIDTLGVAQGSPLSPIIANIYLHDFDKKLEESGINCIRYIDDFVILSTDFDKLNNAVKYAKSLLNDMGLDCYTPILNSEKAETGNIHSNQMNFLGCTLSGRLIMPSNNNRKEFLKKLDNKIKTTISNIEKISKNKDDNNLSGYIDDLYEIRCLILGWGHAFSFCNSSHPLKSMDDKIFAKLNEMNIKISIILKNATDEQKRRILGIPLLTDICLLPSKK